VLISQQKINLANFLIHESFCLRNIVPCEHCKKPIDKNKKDEQSFHISSFANRVVDPVGSGDALLAYSTLALLASHSLVEASIIGAIAAACECELDGNIPISLDNVIKKINDIEKNAQYQIK
jgi:bifunctional ADP-heptose synthase (sugar kinase/adenylyltransferase)